MLQWKKWIACENRFKITMFTITPLIQGQRAPEHPLGTHAAKDSSVDLQQKPPEGTWSWGPIAIYFILFPCYSEASSKFVPRASLTHVSSKRPVSSYWRISFTVSETEMELGGREEALEAPAIRTPQLG